MMITHFQKEDWKKWLFYTLEVIRGSNFQIRSFIVFRENQMLSRIFDNQYSLNLDIKRRTAKVRLEVNEKNDLLAKINGMKRNYSLAEKIEYYPPIPDGIVDQGLRTIDLNIINKVHCMITPTFIEIQMFLLNWDKIKKSLPKHDPHIGEDLEIIKPIIPFSAVPQTEQERNLQLEQPFGLFCKKCGMEYASNLYATLCPKCSERLIPR